MEDDGLGSFGYYILATLNFSATISSFVSSATIKKMGLYTSFFVASMCHFCTCFAQILPAYRLNYPGRNKFFESTTTIEVTLLLAAVINGFGVGVIQTAIGIYIAECATPSTKGFYYGLFWFFYMMSMTVGSLIGAFVLTEGVNETFFYIVLASMALVASISFLFLRKPIPHK